MSKVIVERPRTGDGWRRKGRSIALDDGEGVKLRQRAGPKKTQGSKRLNENLAPLRRYLESNVGRPWNKVHSEIAEHIRPSSTVQQHVLDHVDDFVASKTFIEDGVIYAINRWGQPETLKASWRLLYVDPKSGLLRRNRQHRHWHVKFSRPAPETVEDRRRDIGPFRQAHRFRDGNWWDVVLEADPTRSETVRGADNKPVRRKVRVAAEDVVRDRGLSRMAPERLYGRAGVHAVSARRMSKAEWKRLGI